MAQLDRLQKRIVMPALRIILTNKCNGKCFFCHREGNKNLCSGINEMPIELIREQIIPAIQELQIPKVILTGGEPTFYSELLEVVEMLKISCPDAKLEMTTNGCNLQERVEIFRYIDKVTISVSSFQESVFKKYTDVNPMVLVDYLSEIPDLEKAVSVVITKDNEYEIETIITFFLDHGFDVKLQFVIADGENDEAWESEILERLVRRFEVYNLRLSAAPSLYKYTERGNELRIKLSKLNKYVFENIFVRKECSGCKNRDKCEERGCAIRIFPDGSVSPCLDQYTRFCSANMKQNIKSAFESMEAVTLDSWEQNLNIEELESMRFLSEFDRKFNLPELICQNKCKQAF